MIYSNLSNATDVVLVYDLNDNETIRSIANVPLVFPSPQLKGHEKNKKIVRLFADLCERLNKAGEASCEGIKRIFVRWQGRAYGGSGLF